ncbi:hypothetical protein [Streptomyces sp. NPDC001978]|uniref:hypothetical protein n=1 Tax=Streptomyces sp. NPDC001978 TaxID=3364627 RepID=UPI00368C111C
MSRGSAVTSHAVRRSGAIENNKLGSGLPQSVGAWHPLILHGTADLFWSTDLWLCDLGVQGESRGVMSILGMARATEAIQPVARGNTSPEPGGPGGNAAAAAAESVMTYIPTEVVTAYVAVLGILGSPADRSRGPQWVVFWLFLAITPLAVWAAMAQREIAKGGRVPFHPAAWPIHTGFNIMAATASFVLWGFSLPGSPFQGFGWYSPKIGAAALILGSLVLGLISPLFRTNSAARKRAAEYTA